MSNAVAYSSARAYPCVFRLYPLLNMATQALSLIFFTMNSTIGDFPVPPTDKLPTQIMGRLKTEPDRIFLSNNRLRNKIDAAYRRENGKSKIRMGFSSGALKFINASGSDAKI